MFKKDILWVKKMHKFKLRLIILGSDGYIGSNLKNCLQNNKLKIVPVNRNKIDFLDKKSSDKLSKLIKPNDIIINAIAIAPCKNFDDFHKNILIIKNIQKGIRNKKLFKYINISSDAVYPDTKKKINEKILPNPTSIHGLMHLSREKIIDFSNDCKTIHIRPTLVFGYGDPHGGYGPNLFYRTSSKNNLIKLFGKGEEIRDHIYINDLVYLISKIIFINFTGPINLVTGRGVTFANIAKKFNKFNKNLKIITTKRTQKMPHNGYRLFDNRLIKKLFPKFKFNSFIENLDLMYKNYNERN